MALILQLSDLHLMSGAEEQPRIVESLVGAVAAECERRGGFDLLALTGDVFNDGTLDPPTAARTFERLHDRLCDAMGGQIPTVIVPGNHDRRKLGLFGPHRAKLFDALAARLGGRAWVHGCTVPFLSQVINPAVHDLPLWLVAYDSSFLPRGWLGAGGMIRQQDLLSSAAEINGHHPDWPIVLLMHHHLVPTPLTDLHMVEAHRTPTLIRFGLERVLPSLFANADREELTMTALGAGTALSTLHTLGRAVIVLHGHKHYATARCLDGTVRGYGDVLIVSAGSAGTAEAWAPTSLRETARLWPSFNVLDLEGDQLAVDVVSFGWKGRSQGKSERRPLVRASRAGTRWQVHPLDADEVEPARLAINRADYTLQPSSRFGDTRYDYACERHVALAPGVRLSRYAETVVGADGAELVHRPAAPLPSVVHLALDRTTRYEVIGGVHKALNGKHHAEADRYPPFASLSLMNRYVAQRASIAVRGLNGSTASAFATATDLGTGLEQPLDVIHDGDHAVQVRVDDCPPRTLLRLYWPLERLGG